MKNNIFTGKSFRHVKIASNKISDLIQFYKEQLHGLYDAGELNAIIELVLYHYLGFSKTEVLTRQHENLNQSDVLRIYDCCKALSAGIPVQYAIGVAEFYGLIFKVNSSVLIPRPETEELVDLVIKGFKTEQEQVVCRILDIGTGSGCIPITLKKHMVQAEVFAIDISAEALKTARDNASRLGAAVDFEQADVLKEKDFFKGLAFDLIISNPPYIRQEEAKDMSEQVLAHEPGIALFVEGADDIVFYRRIIDLCRERLAGNGSLYFELNPLTAKDVLAYAKGSGIFKEIQLINDLSGKERFLKAVK